MNVVTSFKSTLSTSMTSTQSTLTPSSLVTGDATPHTLAMTDFGAIGYLVIEPGSAKMEIVSFTGISAGNFTGLTRGLAFYGTDGSEVPGNRYTHQAGSTVIVSNTHYVYKLLMDLDSAQTVTAVKTFSASPIVPTPTADTEVANKKFVSDSMTGLVGNATTTTAGTVKMSSAPAVPASPVVLNNEEVSATSGANKVVKADATGKIHSGFVIGGTSSGLEADTNGTKVKAGVGVVLNTSGVNVVGGSRQTVLVAGEAINGATLPVPVYLDNAADKVYACDGNVQTKLDFIGFAVSNSTDTNPITVQTSGIVGGFTGLNIGSKYYVQDAVGTIETTIGTYDVLVGIAISATELLIQKGYDEYMGTAAVNPDGTTTTAVPVGCKKIIVDCSSGNANANPGFGEHGVQVVLCKGLSTVYASMVYPARTVGGSDFEAWYCIKADWTLGATTMTVKGFVSTCAGTKTVVTNIAINAYFYR